MVFFHDPASLERLSPCLKQTARMLAQLCSTLNKHRIYLLMYTFLLAQMDMHIIKINKGIRSSCKQMSTQPKQKFASSLPTKKRPPSWTVGSPAAEKAAQMAYFVSWRLYASTTWGTCWAVDYMIPKAFKKKTMNHGFCRQPATAFLGFSDWEDCSKLTWSRHFGQFGRSKLSRSKSWLDNKVSCIIVIMGSDNLDLLYCSGGVDF